MSETEASSAPPTKESGKHPMLRIIAGLLSLAVILGAIALGAWLLVRGEQFPRTDDASVLARYTAVATEVPGRVVEVAVEDGQAVEKGDLLVRLDPTSYQLAVEEAAAQVSVLEAELAEAERMREAARAEVRVAEANLELALASEQLAAETLARLEPMVERSFVTAETYDEARASLQEAQASVVAAERQVTAARLAVPELEPIRQQLRAARINERQAAIELDRCTVVAPYDGRVVNLDFPPGRMVLPGEPLFTLVDTSEWFVVARFREGDLRRMSVGKKVDVEVLTAPDRTYTGTVVNIGWGIQTDAQFDATELPFVRAELDWVRLARRFPVRIRVDQPDPVETFRVGASAVATLREQP